MWDTGNLPETEIIWEESDDVYQPQVKSICQFTTEKGIAYQKSQIYITEDAFYNLIKHLESNLRIEQGGILFGNAYQDPNNGIIYVEITAAVAAPATIGTGSHLEFTSESWVGIMECARKEHPQKNIVGWYHSHPNIGVFMSATDRRTQRAFFHHPWSVSIVCDPVRGEIGCFLGKTAVPVKEIVLEKKHRLQEDFQKQITDQENSNSILFFILLALLSIIAWLVPLTIIFFCMKIFYYS